MRIFDFIFKRKKKTKERKLTDTIILEMTKYLMELQIETVSTKSVSELNAEYTRLERIGLGNTGNARKIKEKLDFIQKDKDSRNLGQILLDYIKTVHEIFGITTYLVSVEQFYEITKKHNLELRLLSSFTGDVSEENVVILGAISNKANQHDDLFLNNISAGYLGDQKVFFIDHIIDEAQSRYDETEVQEIEEAFDRIHENLNIITVNPGKYYNKLRDEIDYDRAKDENDWMEDVKFDSLVRLYGKYLDRGDLLIAAKESCFDEENPVVQGNPIIFQVCPYGVLVHLIIGEEADQGILEEYKNLSNDLLG